MLLNKRGAQFKLQRYLSDHEIIRITGPLQAGKTTLLKMMIDEGMEAEYFSMEDMIELNRKLDYPEHLTKKYFVMDEIETIRGYRNKMIGITFFIPGSKVISLISSKSAERSIELLPMSVGEYNAKPERFIDKLFYNEFKPESFDAEAAGINEFILKGSFTEVHRLWDNEMTASWFNGYLNSLMNYAGTISKGDRAVLSRLINLLARFSTSILNTLLISREAEMPNTSFKRYLSLLERLYVIYRIRPVELKSCVKSDKMLFVDTGLLNHMLELRTNESLEASIHYKNIFRNFISMEIIKQNSWLEQSAEIFFYATSRGSDTDLIIKRGDRYVCVIINPGHYFKPNDVKTLKNLSEELGKKFHLGLILNKGNNTDKIEDRIYSVPVNYIWS